MTDREQFEAWAKASGPPFYYDSEGLMSGVAWRTWQAAKATCPAWHDAPTVPGLWLTIDGRHASAAVIPKHELPLYQITTTRWYGPIPEDKP